MSNKLLDKYENERYQRNKEYNEKWEHVISRGGGSDRESVSRLKVPSGWIYKTEQFLEYSSKQGYGFVMSTCFVPETKE